MEVWIFFKIPENHPEEPSKYNRLNDLWNNGYILLFKLGEGYIFDISLYI